MNRTFLVSTPAVQDGLVKQWRITPGIAAQALKDAG